MQSKQCDQLALLSQHRRAVMGLAAIWIMLYHQWTSIFSQVPGLSSFEVYFCLVGYCSVDMFFLLSGLGLVFSIEKNSLGKFYLNRFTRVYPGFLIVAIGSAITKKWTLVQFLRNISGISYYFGNGLYSFLWYVPAILTLYLLFPLFYRFFKQINQKEKFLLCLLPVWFVLSIAFRNILREDLYSLTNRLPIFCFGIYLGYRLKEKKPFSVKLPILWAMLIVGLILAYLTIYRQRMYLIPITEYTLPGMLLCTSIPVLVLTGINRISDRVMGQGLLKFLSFYGEMSLEFYCVHDAVGYFVKPFISGLPAIVINLIVFAACTLTAYAMHKTLEFLLKPLK